VRSADEFFEHDSSGGLIMFRKHFLIGLTLGAALSGVAQAQETAVAAVKSERNWGVGLQQSGTSSGTPVNQVHFLMNLNQRSALGLGFGFSGNFTNALVGLDYRVHLRQRGEYNPYASFGLAYAKFSGNTAATFSTMIGLEYAITEYLRVDFGFGLMMAKGIGTGAATTTDSRFVNNFAFHWFF
jgi:hypothetical protein